jgi:WD40 repeat protein/transcriptional regulator with XRE-family HTH domain
MPAMAEPTVLGFAGLLRQLRAEARLTQEELAEAAGISPRSVSDLERGVNRTARKDTAELLAGALGLAGPARAVFVAAARGRAPAAEVLAAVRGEARPAADGPPAGESPVWSGCPYLGLVPFGERDARVFYGRGEPVAQLAQRLAGRLDQPAGMLVVAGESGAGKSSLLRAGLMPWLAAGALGPGSERWPRRVIQPAGQPVRELAMALAEVAGTDPVSVYRSLLGAPGEAPMLVELAVRTAAGRGPAPGPGGPADAAACPPPRLVLVVDQFEELFTAAGDAEDSRGERAGFLAALHAAATVPAGPRKCPAALVVAAVRADYLGHLIADPALKAWVDAGLFTVGPMSEAELRLAITGPAAEAGLAVEPALIEAVIAELRAGAGGGLGTGVLPLMSQAMAATWQYREGSTLTLRGYRRAGGVADAVNLSAQAAYDTLTSRQKDAARLVFTQLTVITADGQLARRRCSRADLRSPGTQAADIDAVIDVFSAPRLLVLGEDSVEVAHDALLQAWKQLREWLEDDQLDRVLYGQVITDAAAWDDNGRDASYLYRTGRLATIDAAASRWQDAPARYPPLPATGKAFLDAAHHAARRTIRRRRSGFATLAALTALAVVASVVAFHQRAAAVQQRDQAIYNQVDAQALQYGTSDTTLAAQLTLAGYRLQPTQDLASRLLDTENTPLATSVAVGGGFVNSVVFSRNGRTLASGSSDGMVRLWDIADPARAHPLGGPLTGGPRGVAAGAAGGVTPVALSPDGHMMASGGGPQPRGDNNTVELWAVADPAHPSPLGQLSASDNGGTDSVAFSPDGHVLAVGSLAVSPGLPYASEIQLWDIADPTRPNLLGELHIGAAGTGTSVNSVAFTRDGHTLASGDSDGTVWLWNIADPAHPRLRGPIPASGTASVQSVAFSPDGHTLASGSLDGTVRLWDLGDAAHPKPLSPIRTGGAVNSVAFSPDGHVLASGSLDGTIKLWNVTDPAQPSPLGQPLAGGTGAVYSVAFSPDGRTLASGNSDGIIRLWNIPQTVLTGSTGASGSVAFSPDGHTLASASTDGSIQLWDVADPARPQPLGQPLTSSTAAVDSVAFSPDGHTLASGSLDGTIRLWSVADPTHHSALGTILTGASVLSVAFSPRGHTLGVGSLDDAVRLWDVADPAHPRLRGPILTGGGGTAAAPTTGISSVAFSPDGNMLAIGDLDSTVKLLDVADPAHPLQLGLALTGAPVYSLAFNPQGNILAVGHNDGTIQLRDVADPASLRELGQPLTGSTVAVDSVAFSPDGHTLASGSDDGTVRLWNLNVQSAINRICATAGGLTPQQWNEYIPQLPYRTTCAH